MRIPVVFTPDENYIVPTSVAILSMLRTKNSDTDYSFYIVVSERLEKKLFRYLERIKELVIDFEYKIVYFNTEIFDKQKITTKHLSTSAYYRLALADILLDCDKCMYHDGDILVCSDLSPMYNVNLKDYYVAGIKAIMRHQDTKQNIQLMRRLGFPSFDNYILSGDLVFNLAKIREDKLTAKMMAEMDKGFPSEDQDIINLCCYDKIYFLPLKFCMMNRWIYNDALEQIDKQVYSEPEIIEAKKSPAIIHFAGSNIKPWNNLRTTYCSEWWGYAKEILNPQEYFKWHQRAEELTNKRDWHYLKQQLSSYKNVMIFGFSRFGKELCMVLQRWGYEVECFIDNDRRKQGKIFEGCKVLSVSNALEKYKEIVIINAVQRYQEQVMYQLISLGVRQERIISYEAKNEVYYLCLSTEWSKYEINDICVKEHG